MRDVIRNIFDFLIDSAITVYGVALALSAAVVWLVPAEISQSFLTTSLPPMPGVAIPFVGFIFTALSILVSLKGSPFFVLLQEENPTVWRNMVGAFTHQASIFALLGLFSLSINAEKILKFQSPAYQIATFVYFALVFLSVFATLLSLYLLRLIANAPAVADKKIDRIDPASFAGLQDPTNAHTPVRLNSVDEQ